MKAKRRRDFQLEDAHGTKLATGVLYDEGNVQVLWRVDIGYTAEQYASIRLDVGFDALHCCNSINPPAVCNPRLVSWI